MFKVGDKVMFGESIGTVLKIHEKTNWRTDYVIEAKSDTNEHKGYWWGHFTLTGNLHATHLKYPDLKLVLDNN